MKVNGVVKTGSCSFNWDKTEMTFTYSSSTPLFNSALSFNELSLEGIRTSSHLVDPWDQRLRIEIRDS